MQITLTYLKTDKTTEFVGLTFPAAPFAALVIDPDAQSPDTQFELCHALVEAGCADLGAWGPQSTQWDNSGDYAALLTRDGSLRTPEYDLSTWWLDSAPIKELFKFCMTMRSADDAPISNVLVFEFGDKFGETVVSQLFAAADSS